MKKMLLFLPIILLCVGGAALAEDSVIIESSMETKNSAGRPIKNIQKVIAKPGSAVINNITFKSETPPAPPVVVPQKMYADPRVIKKHYVPARAPWDRRYYPARDRQENLREARPGANRERAFYNNYPAPYEQAPSEYGSGNSEEMEITESAEYGRMESYGTPAPTEPITGKWYAGFYGAYNMTSWTYKIKDDPGYSPGPGEALEADKPWAGQFGGGVVIGQKFSNAWKLEAEAGYFSETTDEFANAGLNGTLTFSESVIYAAANAIYQLPDGMYVGVGAGAAMASMKFNDTKGSGGSTTGLLGQVMAGYETDVGERAVFNIGAKASMYQSKAVGYPNISDITMELGMVMNLTATAGIRFYF